jgi:hypothetical protein
MHKTEGNEIRIGFGIVTNDAFFYGLRYYDLNVLNKTKLASLQTSAGRYSDVLIIEPDTVNAKYASCDHYVLRMYWSKSSGLVRYDKNGSVYYTLTKKHGL